jgi:hypothetical protein
MKQLHQSQIDNDNCRIYFRDDDRTLYCFQLERRGEFEFFECTAQGEPLAHVDLESFAFGNVAGPDSLEPIAREFNAWFDGEFTEYETTSLISR